MGSQIVNAVDPAFASALWQRTCIQNSSSIFARVNQCSSASELQIASSTEQQLRNPG